MRAIFLRKLRITRLIVWHVACKYHDRVSYVTKSAATFLVLMILSPVTAPFASFPLSALLTHQADTHAAIVVTSSDASVAPAGTGTVLVEEQMKDGDVLLDSRLASGDTFDHSDLMPLVYFSTAADCPPLRLVVLRV